MSREQMIDEAVRRVLVNGKGGNWLCLFRHPNPPRKLTMRASAWKRFVPRIRAEFLCVDGKSRGLGND